MDSADTSSTDRDLSDLSDVPACRMSRVNASVQLPSNSDILERLYNDHGVRVRMVRRSRPSRIPTVRELIDQLAKKHEKLIEQEDKGNTADTRNTVNISFNGPGPVGVRDIRAQRCQSEKLLTDIGSLDNHRNPLDREPRWAVVARDNRPTTLDREPKLAAMQRESRLAALEREQRFGVLDREDRGLVIDVRAQPGFRLREGESCNHVSALLWGLVDVTNKKADGTLASTSSECKWKQPRKRKLSPKKAEDMHFCKVLKKEKQPADFRNFSPTGNNRPFINIDILRLQIQSVLPNAGYLKNFTKPPIAEEIKRQCCLPEPLCCFREGTDITGQFAKEQFAIYENSLTFDPERVEELTRGQRNNDLWTLSRKGRVTASNFGAITKCVKDTALIKTVMGYYNYVSSDAIEWGQKREKSALGDYIKDMKSTTTENVKVCESGLVIHKDHPFIGASPDGIVKCGDEVGVVEVKCPFKYRHFTPEQAAGKKDFMCEKRSDGTITLKKSHNYYKQVQGQMALTGYEWCDFVVWTTKGMSVERIRFNKELWDSMLAGIVNFYRQSILPELFTCKVKRTVSA